MELEQAIQQYNYALKQLVQTLHPSIPISQPEAQDSPVEHEVVVFQAALKHQISPAKVIQVLIARDRVQSALEALATSVDSPPLYSDKLEQLIKLDEILKQQARAIALFTQSTDWRASFNPKESSWWWFLESPRNWLWKGISIACLTVSFGLISDIAPRFLMDVPDSLGAFTVSAQSVLTLLAAGSILTKSGQEGLRHLLRCMNIREKYWYVLGVGGSLLLLLSLFMFRQSLPVIGTKYFTHPGIESWKKGDWSSAEERFKRAIRLNANDAEAHFQLGILYEDLQIPDQARQHYLLAIHGGISEATNNLARFNILKKDYSAAVSLLLKALSEEQKKPLNSKTKYAVLKNLGWARFKQGNYPDAEANLSQAIDLQSTIKLEKDEIAAPHCLLAQVREAQKDTKAAQTEWKTCNQYVNITIPEQDEWAVIAQKRVKPQEADK
ncbi:tetratricopeptide repeat protein [Mastigocladus laminosus UU774]|nr:tetratricopeptide repeat protein [Mastigocladus laminosus UU774]